MTNSNGELSTAEPEPSAPVDDSQSKRPWLWPLIVCAIALIPVRGVLSLGEIFYYRDLTVAAYPAHCWFRNTIFSGELPFWDPYVAGGQSAIGDSVRMICFPPVLLLRMLFPQNLGFNLAVALPFPVAALGAYAMLRRHVERPAAALGALVFVLSGPMLSTGNTLNLSWSIACLPWMLWAADRFCAERTVARFAGLAALFGIQMLAVEPVAIIGSATLVGAWAFWRGGVKSFALAAFAGVVGLALAAVQVIPALQILPGSSRPFVQDTWPLDPRRFVEVVAPFFYGDALADRPLDGSWLTAVNSGREPFFLSVFLGVAAIALAAFAIGSARNRGAVWFWTAVVGIAVVLALGDLTPVYSLLRTAVPPLKMLRYPIKYTLFVAMGVAWLNALGWQAFANPDKRGALVRLRLPLVLLASVVVAVLGSCGWALSGGDATQYLRQAILSGAPRVLLVALIVGALFWLAVSHHAKAPIGRVLLGIVILADLVAANGNLNPTLDARIFETPEWVAATRDDAHSRVYIPGREALGGPKVESSGQLSVQFDPATASWAAFSSALDARRTRFPSQHGIREAISADPTGLWPASYNIFVEKFTHAGQEYRARVLGRLGVRFHVVPRPPEGPSRKVADVAGLEPYAVYEAPFFPRAFVTANAVVVADPGQQLNALFSPSLDYATTAVLESQPPDPVGDPGQPLNPAARITSDQPNRVDLIANAPSEGGYLVLLDSYGPEWTATVDGRPAPLLKGDGLFRVVRLAPGSHSVTFAYNASAFFAGAIVSTIVALVLLGATFLSHKRNRAMHTDLDQDRLSGQVEPQEEQSV